MNKKELYENRRLNLLLLIDAKWIGKTKIDLANALEVTPSYLSRMLYPEGKKAKKNIGEDIVYKINQLFELRPGWLDVKQTGQYDLSVIAQGMRTVLEVAEQRIAYTINQNLEPGPNIQLDREYPLISWVEAGQWTELCDNFNPGEAEDWKPCHKNLGKCGYILRVKGRSMTAPEGEQFTFPEGILLYVNPDAEPLPGKFVIARRKGNTEATFKKLTLVDGEPYLEAINPDWPNRYLKLDDGDVLCGVVMHAGFDMP